MADRNWGVFKDDFRMVCQSCGYKYDPYSPIIVDGKISEPALVAKDIKVTDAVSLMTTKLCPGCKGTVIWKDNFISVETTKEEESPIKEEPIDGGKI